MEVTTLSKELGQKYIEQIVQLHNMIPFQKWNADDFFLEGDKRRIYKNKWEISSICFIKDTVVGICVAFLDNETIINNINDFVYLHRIAVLPEYRNQGIGTNMITYSCNRFKEVYSGENDKEVIVLTPIKSLNKTLFQNAEGFYLKVGFVKIGERNELEKIDSILTARISTLLN